MGCLLLALSPFAHRLAICRESSMPILMGSSPVDQQYEFDCYPAWALCMLRVLGHDASDVMQW